MVKTEGTHWCLLTIAVVTGFLAVLVCWKYVGERRGARLRGMVALNIMKHEMESIRDYRLSKQRRMNARGEAASLQQWLVLDLMVNQHPLGTAKKFERRIRGRNSTKNLLPSHLRWRRALVSWSEDPVRTEANSLLELGLNLYGQAAGYDRTGLTYDATVNYLRSADALMKFIEKAPGRVEVPQAVFLIGLTFFKFRHVLPMNSRPDRILNLCIELFPNTLWAERAYTARREELSAGA